MTMRVARTPSGYARSRSFVKSLRTLYGAGSTIEPEGLGVCAAYVVARDDENGLLVAGWTSQDEKSSRQATILAFDELLTEAEVRWVSKATILTS